jgi:hypothetical protein
MKNMLKAIILFGNNVVFRDEVANVSTIMAGWLNTLNIP